MSSATTKRETATAGTSGVPPAIIDESAGDFINLNRKSFSFTHHLGNDALFAVPRLARLAEHLWSKGAGKVTFQAGNITPGTRWEDAPKKRMSVIDAINNISQSGCWVLLKGVQDDAHYRDLMLSCFTEVEKLSGIALQKQVSWMDAYIFIASPESVTPFHIDHECNCLMQIHGEKEITVFDQDDRAVLTDAEIERYYVGELSAARFKEAAQQRGIRYHLAPGLGVHLPVRAPHWVKNGSDYSVSFSVHFFLHAEDRKARIYQLNHYLRELQMKPTPPGRSPLRDKMKIGAVGLIGLGSRARSKAEVLRRGVKRLDAISQVAKRLVVRNNGAGAETNH